MTQIHVVKEFLSTSQIPQIWRAKKKQIWRFCCEVKVFATHHVYLSVHLVLLPLRNWTTTSARGFFGNRPTGRKNSKRPSHPSEVVARHAADHLCNLQSATYCCATVLKLKLLKVEMFHSAIWPQVHLPRRPSPWYNTKNSSSFFEGVRFHLQIACIQQRQKGGNRLVQVPPLVQMATHEPISNVCCCVSLFVVCRCLLLSSSFLTSFEQRTN